jgi:Holliday junction resolvase RusA-like endonuclease
MYYMITISFSVLGKPQSKGAHTSFVPTRKDGSWAVRPNGRPLVVTKDTNDNQFAAQQGLAKAALAARVEAEVGIIDGPVRVERRYYFVRPKSHYGTGKNAGLLKDSAPLLPITAADLDKLDRLVFDALTGTVIRDDKLVCAGEPLKFYAEGDEPPRTEVEVSAIEPTTVGQQVVREQLALAP